MNLSKRFALGKLFGVEVSAHNSLVWVLGFLAIVALLSSGVAGLLGGALLLFGVVLSVTLHELGHIGAATLFGNSTRGILLTPLGGVAELERDARSPREELVVALAGPAVSLLLAGLTAIPLVLLGPATSTATLGPALLATWFLRLNLILGLFNLLPAFPMDGGRVLRALLWKRKGKERATQLAARAGQGFGVAFALAAPFVSPVLFFVGLYVLWHASATLTHLRVRREAQALGLDPAAVAAFLFGRQQAQPQAKPASSSSGPRVVVRESGVHYPQRPRGAFSRVEYVRMPDGTLRAVDRSPW